jgi:Fe2+ transport system protein FeoA
LFQGPVVLDWIDGVEIMSHVQARTLSDLQPGAEAVVTEILATGKIRHRLLEMGFVRGARIKVEKLAPMGDPMELVIKGYHLSLRREEGQCILVSEET